VERVMRKTKFGGISPCSSPPDKVGKGRCFHVLEEGDDVVLRYDKDEKAYYLDLSHVKQGESLKVEDAVVKKFIKEIRDSISEEQKSRIINFLNRHN